MSNTPLPRIELGILFEDKKTHPAIGVGLAVEQTSEVHDFFLFLLMWFLSSCLLFLPSPLHCRHGSPGPGAFSEASHCHRHSWPASWSPPEFQHLQPSKDQVFGRAAIGISALIGGCMAYRGEISAFPSERMVGGQSLGTTASKRRVDIWKVSIY